MKSKSQVIKSKNTKHKDNLNTSLTQVARNKDEFEDKIMEIDIKKPRSPFNFFILEMREKHNIKGSITDSSKQFAEKYSRLSGNELSKFQKLSDDDRQRYEANMKMVRKYVLDKPFKEKATARSLFIEERLAELRDSHYPTKEQLNQEKDKAAEEWDEMDSEEKKQYEEKLEEHKKMYEDMKKSVRKTQAYNLYMKDQMAKARKNDKTLSFKDVAAKWEKCTDEEKEKYNRYAQEQTEDNQKRRNIYEIAYGLKPKNPLGALKFYFNELKSMGKVKLLKEAKAKWEKLDDDEREKYLKMEKKERLAFILKKREYKALNKKERAPSAYNLFVKDLKGTDTKVFSEQGFFTYAAEKFRNLSSNEIRKLEERSKKLKEEMDAKKDEKAEIEELKPKKKPNSAYNIYIRERVPEIKKKFPNMVQTDVFAQCAEDFKNISTKELKVLEEKAEQEKLDYEKRMKKYELKLEKYNEKEKTNEDEKKRSKSKSKQSSKKRSKSKGKNSTKKNGDQSESEYETENEKDTKKKKKNKTTSKSTEKKKQTKGKKSKKSSENDDSESEMNRSQSSRGTSKSKKRESSRKTKTKGRK
jgi:hypothetical protein